jgi:serine/threonine-protein kinase
MIIPPRYKVLKGPVSGGFGTIFVCEDTQLRRQVVIKQISDKAELKRLIDEILALQKVRSRHVVQIYDLIIDNVNSELALIEEFLPNSDLTTFSGSGFSVQDYYKVLYQIACGTRDIHSCGIVHRDLKPNNMKYDQDGAIKIFDFGLAKLAPLPKSTSVVIGTPGFMAPELFAMPPQIDTPVDAYAFGATAFVLASGNLPPTAPKGFGPPRALAPGETISNIIGVTPSVAQAIDTCLSMDPATRPTLESVAHIVKRELLANRHRALVTDGAKALVLDNNNRRVRAARRNTDAIEIEYDGYDFRVSRVVGDVSINNRPALAGEILDGSYVIVLGASGTRRFVTFDVSHPEVLI